MRSFRVLSWEVGIWEKEINRHFPARHEILYTHNGIFLPVCWDNQWAGSWDILCYLDHFCWNYTFWFYYILIFHYRSLEVGILLHVSCSFNRIKASEMHTIYIERMCSVIFFEAFVKFIQFYEKMAKCWILSHLFHNWVINFSVFRNYK